MRRFLVCIAILASCSNVSAQYVLSPLNPTHTSQVRDYMARTKAPTPTAFWPFLMNESVLDSITDIESGSWNRKTHENWVMRKLRNEHLIEVREPDFTLLLDAAWDLEASFQLDDRGRRMFTNTRGLQLTGTVGKRVFFGSSFYENQSIFPTYLDSIVSKRGNFNAAADPERGSVPGYGRWKPFNTSDSYDYDYTMGTGYVGVALNDHSFVQLGHDKQFLGYGYRSMLLSDVSAPYPLLRVHLSFLQEKLTYTTTWAVLQSLERVSENYNSKEAMFRRLGARFSYLHYQPAHWFGVGLFDGTTWTWRDNNHPASIEYYMPYAWLYSGNGIRHHVVGLNGHVQPLHWLNFYGQWVMANGLQQGAPSYQIGMRISELLPGLQLVCEMNQIGMGTYHNLSLDSHTTYASEPFEDGRNALNYYQHNDHSLGHPMLVSSTEYLVRARYRVRDFVVSGAYHYTVKQRGNPALMAPYPHQHYFQFEGGYMFNPKSNMQLVLGTINRTEKKQATSMIDTYTYVAFRTNLFNRYRDF